MLLFATALGACSRDPVEGRPVDSGGPAPGAHEPAPVTDAAACASVVVLARERCGACHGGGVVSGGLDSSQGVCNETVEVDALNHDGVLVRPGDLDASILWHKVAANGQFGPDMPSEGGLEPADPATVETWIPAGAPCPVEETTADEEDPVGCPGEDEADPTQVDLRAGRSLHRNICMLCHATDSAPQLSVVVPESTDGRLEEIVCKGSGVAADLVAGLTYQEFLDLLAFLRMRYPGADG